MAVLFPSDNLLFNLTDVILTGAMALLISLHFMVRFLMKIAFCCAPNSWTEVLWIITVLFRMLC